MKNELKINEIINQLPTVPGVYQYFDRDGNLIYIGKAKNLKKRVSSYFNHDLGKSGKLRVLVNKIVDIKYIIVESESDALLLENNLIKKFKPRYNILLKDDKTFPWIVIRNEPFQRVESSRNYINDGSEYFGPYTSAYLVKTVLSLIRKLYPLRNCNLDLSEIKIKTNKYKPCLEYHVGNCLAPCISAQSNDSYSSNIQIIKNILKGNISSIEDYLEQIMKSHAAVMDFEKANIIKEKLDLLKNYRSKSTIVLPSINNVDVFSYALQEDDMVINFMRIINGAIVQVHSVVAKRIFGEEIPEILSTAITEIRHVMMSSSKEIIVPVIPDLKLENIKYTIPKQGDKLKLLELSSRNAKQFLNEKIKISSSIAKKFEDKKYSTLENLRTDLKLNSIPFHIECFDNSNLQGTNPVASCVVFKNGKPAKSEYRHFNVKSVIGPDDFSTMKEIVFRRYRRQLDENNALPDLIVVDGGKGQLNAAMESLEKLELLNRIQIIGIAKKLEEVFRPGDPIPLYIDKSSQSLKIIQHIRNEAHRFGIAFHRQKRSGKFLESELDRISGIGDKLKNRLLIEFKSVEGIRNAPLDEIKKIVGAAKAEIVKTSLRKI
jgi:excinuclease ABC subunit C